MFKKYLLIFLMICCMGFINATPSFANGETGNLKIKVNLNGNGNLINNDSFEVNYYNENVYNIFLTEFAKGITREGVPIGKYKLDYIAFVSGKRLHLELKAPKNFEIKKNELTEITFELVKKDINSTNTPDETQKQDITLTPESTMQETEDSGLTGTKTDKSTPMVAKTPPSKNYHIDYLSIVLLITLVIALLIIKKKSKIKVD